MKKSNNKYNFLKSLGIEVDNEVAKGIKKVGVIPIVLAVILFFFVKFLVSQFGSEDDMFDFYFISIVAFLFLIGAYTSDLKKDSKIKFSINSLGLIFSVLLSIILLIGALMVIFYLISDLVYWIIDLFN